MPHIELNGIKYGIGGAGGGGGEPVYTLGLGTEIPAGANLDSYITPGVY